VSILVQEMRFEALNLASTVPKKELFQSQLPKHSPAVLGRFYTGPAASHGKCGPTVRKRRQF